MFRRAREPSDEERAARVFAQLTDSRRAIVQAYEVERHRIERDLHDGTQQYLVAANMKIGEARISPAVAADPALARLLDDAQNLLATSLRALRATVRGIHPQVLTDSGLVVALEEVVASSSLPAEIVCPHPLPHLDEAVLAVGYFFTCEAMTNAAKHAPGAPISVLITVGEDLNITVLDEGSGGAMFVPGRGLAGLSERLAAFGGHLELSSPPGGPTRVAARIPLLLYRGESGVLL